MTRKDDLGNEDATASSEITNSDMAGSGVTVDDPKNTTKTGSDLPKGSGQISDEGFNKISGKKDTRPTGADKSTEDREDQMPTSGVGAFEDSSQPLTQTIAHIEDEEK